MICLAFRVTSWSLSWHTDFTMETEHTIISCMHIQSFICCKLFRSFLRHSSVYWDAKVCRIHFCRLCTLNRRTLATDVAWRTRHQTSSCCSCLIDSMGEPRRPVIITKQCNIYVIHCCSRYGIVPHWSRQCPPWCIYGMPTSFHKCSCVLGEFVTVFYHMLATSTLKLSNSGSQCNCRQMWKISSQGIHRVWFFSAVGPSNKTAFVWVLMDRERTGYS